MISPLVTVKLEMASCPQPPPQLNGISKPFWSVPFFTRELLPFTVAWTVVNGLAAALFSVSFTMLSASATDATRGRVMTFAYLPANLGFVVGPAIGSLVASVDVFLVFPAAALLTVLAQPVTAG